VGQKVQLIVLQVDKGTGQVKVSRKALLDDKEADNLQPEPPDNSAVTKALPTFPVTPPKAFDRNYFRSKVASSTVAQTAEPKTSNQSQSQTPRATAVEVETANQSIGLTETSIQEYAEKLAGGFINWKVLAQMVPTLHILANTKYISYVVHEILISLRRSMKEKSPQKNGGR
jgi:hypothetical protein